MSKEKTTISQIEFSRMCGMSKQAVGKAIKLGNIAIATRKGVKKVHLNHKITQLYLEKKRAEASLTGTSVIISTPSPGSGEENGETDSLVSLQQQKTVEEIGKIKADRKLKELKYEIEEGKLIEKDTLGAVIFQYLDALNINMLEFPDMIIDTLIDKVKSGSTRGECIEFMRKDISKAIVSTKTQINERLK